MPKSKQNIKVVVGLSGGVDSSVSAYLLKQQGYQVVGVFMQNWQDDDNNEFCSSRQDFLDAASVADLLDIEIVHVNFAQEYKDRVFAEFLTEYNAGRTPNPDILCNAEIKFKAFLDYALSIGAEKIATGHYARVRFNSSSQQYQLLKGVDSNKDQSYFLHRLTQHQLSKVLFPVGELEKTAVRNIASQIGLPNAKKKDSTGICFIGERPFREFLQRYISDNPGAIYSDKGQLIGQHVGLSFYTLGQRHGLGVGGIKEVQQLHGAGEHLPWYVATKDVANNRLWAVQGHAHPWLNYTQLQAIKPSWIAGQAPMAGHYSCKTRYRQVDSACEFLATATSESFNLDFTNCPQWAVTPGQSAVLYAGEVCLGGGIIDTGTTVAEINYPQLQTIKSKNRRRQRRNAS